MWKLNPNNKTQLYDETTGLYKKINPNDCLLLQLLLECQGEVVSKKNIFDNVWKGKFVSDSSLTQSIAQLRMALGDNGKEQRIIKTIPRKGYMLCSGFVQLQLIPTEKDEGGKCVEDRVKNIWVDRIRFIRLALYCLSITISSYLIYKVNDFHFIKMMNNEKVEWNHHVFNGIDFNIKPDKNSEFIYKSIKKQVSFNVKNIFISSNSKVVYVSCIYNSLKTNSPKVKNLSFSTDLSSSYIAGKVNDSCS